MMRSTLAPDGCIAQNGGSMQQMALSQAQVICVLQTADELHFELLVPHWREKSAECHYDG